MKKIILAILLTLFPQGISAHCPLCTVGAGAAGGLAVWLGVSQGVVGIFIGAFGFAIGIVMGKKIKLIPKHIFGLVSFLLTVLPTMALFKDMYGLYLPFAGESGEVFVINEFLLGSVIGALILIFSPLISERLKKIRGKIFMFQTMIITFFLLFLVSIIMEIFVF